MNFRALRAALCLAEELHFGRAADRLSMAQPQLSGLIRRLEDETGVVIFVRRPSVQVTEAGEVIIRLAKRTLSEMEREAHRAREIADGLAGTVRLGFSAAAMLGELPAALHAFSKEYPDTKLEVSEQSTGRLFAGLLEGEYDLVIGRGEITHPSVQSVCLIADHALLMVPEDHPLAGKRVDLRELAGETIIFFTRERAPEYYDSLWLALSRAGLDAKRIMEAGGWTGICALVAAHFGISFGTKLFSRIKYPGITYCEFKGKPADTSFWLSSVPTMPSPAAERLRHKLLQLPQAR